MKNFTIVALICISPVTISATLSQQEQQQIMTSVKLLKDATNSGNFTVTINLIPDQFYKLSKISKATLISITKKVTTKLKSDGFKIRGKYQKPETAYHCKQSKVAFVRGKIHMQIRGKKYITTGFLIASRNHSTKEWRFLDGSNPGTRRRSFYNAMYGCQGIKLNIPPYSMKKL